MEAKSHNGAFAGSPGLSSYWFAPRFTYLHETNDKLGNNHNSVTARAEKVIAFGHASGALRSIELEQQSVARLTHVDSHDSHGNI